MEYVAIAYVLIFLVIIGYIFNVRQRTRAVKRERAVYESKDK